MHTVGVTVTKNIYTFAYCFIRNEAEDDYLWAMQNLRRVFGMSDIATPKLFAVDREMTLMDSLGGCFYFARTLLCRWQINEDITAKGVQTITAHMELPGTRSNNDRV